ncbi:MAG: hypothetical protein ACYST6_15900 [Planctomycetota bacterium]
MRTLTIVSTCNDAPAIPELGMHAAVEVVDLNAAVAIIEWMSNISGQPGCMVARRYA